jgi:hypothetical protein
MRKRLEEVENKRKQAGAELCQAHVKLGLSTARLIFFYKSSSSLC